MKYIPSFPPGDVGGLSEPSPGGALDSAGGLRDSAKSRRRTLEAAAAAAMAGDVSQSEK